MNVWYHVGSKDEPAGRQGFAHLFEHLMFNGSENHNDEFFRPLAEAGATKINGTTWMDRTNYFQNVPTPALDRVLWLESDRMGHLLGAVDQAKLDEQRGVVLNEKRQGENQPYGRVWTVITRSIYPPGHPYSWTTIGSEKDLNAATLDDVKSWFRAHYGAANATLVVAGDHQAGRGAGEGEAVLRRHSLRPVRERIDAWPAKRQGSKRSVLEDRVPQPRIIKVWNTPGLCDPDAALLTLAGGILADGRTSRLYQRLVYRDRTATSVSSASYPFEIASPMTLDAYVQPGGDAAVVDRVMEEELKRFLQTGPTPLELQRAKTRYFAARTRGLEQIDGRAGKSGVLATYQVYCGSPDALAEEADRIRRAPRPTCSAPRRAWLDDGVFTLTVVPFPEYSTAESRRRPLEDAGARRRAGPAPAAAAAFHAVQRPESGAGGVSQRAGSATEPAGGRRLRRGPGRHTGHGAADAGDAGRRHTDA